MPQGLPWPYAQLCKAPGTKEAKEEACPFAVCHQSTPLPGKKMEGGGKCGWENQVCWYLSPYIQVAFSLNGITELNYLFQISCTILYTGFSTGY